MKPRPFYRWKSFWLGLCLTCFLAWAWWDSWRYASGVEVEWKGDKIIVGTADGLCGITWGMRGLGGFNFSLIRVLLTETKETRNRDFVAVPDSLVFFSFVGLWGGWLVWRWKRKQKKLA